MMRWMLASLLLGLLGLVSALSASGNQLLVVVDQESDKAKYSQFWTGLQDRGFQITYQTAKDSSLSLFRHGTPAYSHLLLLPTKAKGLGPALTPNLLVEFVNAGSNILLALSAETPPAAAISSLLLELDISLPTDRSSQVIDHFNFDALSASEQHDTVLVRSVEEPKKGVKGFFGVDGLVAFPHAVGHVLGNASPLLSSIVKSPSTSYIYSAKDDAESAEDPFATGSQINLVSAFQARNSARFTVLGSAEALEDKWFDASVQLPGSGRKSEKTGNKEFASKVAAWTFQEVGVLRVENVQHRLREGEVPGNATAAAVNPSIYRIKTKVHYSVDVSEWDNDQWIPFVVPEGDNLQLEFSMLSPFHRINLALSDRTTTSAQYTTEFVLPDQHGIFNFFLEYRRPFVTVLENKVTVTVRHFAHDEWPRSYVISGAWPWISGIGVTVAGWVVFVAVWLYSKPADEKVKRR